MNFYREFFSEGDLVYDVGANTGSWTQACLDNGAGHVLAIEPQKSLCDGLVNRFMDKPVRILHCAVGDFRGQAQMFQCEANTIASLNPEWTKHRFSSYSWEQGETVMVITLDEVIGYYGLPVFIKIDVEGYEPKVLSGLTIPINGYCLEYTAEFMNQLYECIALIERFGKHEFSYNLGDYPEFKCPWVDRDTIILEMQKIYKPDVWGNFYARRKYDS